MRVQDLGRVQQIAAALAKNGFGQVFSSIGLGQHLPAGRDGDTTAPWARRVRQVLIDLGPTYVKLGQVLSVRPDILPAALLEEFQSLQDRVPAMPFEEVRIAVEEELGRPLEDVFDRFDPTPIGAASIAQVHRAKLAGGPEVAVKLQRPNIEKMIRSDVSILYTLASYVEGRVEIPGMYTPAAIVQEFEVAILKELDFFQEMRAAQRMAANFEGNTDVHVPRVFPNWCTRRMMVMELLDGVPLSKKMAEADAEEKQRLAHRLMDATYKQVFDHGFFHGDPHPGNIFVLEDGRIAFIDFGVTGLLTESMKDTILMAFTSLVFRDADTFAMTVYRAGATNERIDLRAFRDDCEKMMVKYYGASLDDIASPTTLTEVVQLASEYRINLPAEYAVLSRAVGLIEGSMRALLPGIDIVAEVSPYAQRLMRDRFSVERVAGDAARLIFQTQGHLKDFPTQLSQVLMDLEGERLTLNIIDRDKHLVVSELAELRREINLGGLRISLALMASTVTLGSLLFLATWNPTIWGFPLFGLLAFGTLGLGLGLFGALGVHVFLARFLDPRVWRARFIGIVRFFSWRRSK